MKISFVIFFHKKYHPLFCYNNAPKIRFLHKLIKLTKTDSTGLITDRLEVTFSRKSNISQLFLEIIAYFKLNIVKRENIHQIHPEKFIRLKR